MQKKLIALLAVGILTGAAWADHTESPFNDQPIPDKLLTPFDNFQFEDGVNTDSAPADEFYHYQWEAIAGTTYEFSTAAGQGGASTGSLPYWSIWTLAGAQQQTWSNTNGPISWTAPSTATYAIKLHQDLGGTFTMAYRGIGIFPPASVPASSTGTILATIALVLVSMGVMIRKSA